MVLTDKLDYGVARVKAGRSVISGCGLTATGLLRPTRFGGGDSFGTLANQVSRQGNDHLLGMLAQFYRADRRELGFNCARKFFPSLQNCFHVVANEAGKPLVCPYGCTWPTATPG